MYKTLPFHSPIRQSLLKNLSEGVSTATASTIFNISEKTIERYYKQNVTRQKIPNEEVYEIKNWWLTACSPISGNKEALKLKRGLPLCIKNLKMIGKMQAKKTL